MLKQVVDNTRGPSQADLTFGRQSVFHDQAMLPHIVAILAPIVDRKKIVRRAKAPTIGDDLGLGRIGGWAIRSVKGVAQGRSTFEEGRFVGGGIFRAQVNGEFYIGDDGRAHPLIRHHVATLCLEGVDRRDDTFRQDITIGQDQDLESVQAPLLNSFFVDDLRLEVGVLQHVIGIARPGAAPAIGAPSGENLGR